ncbi:MAG: hypothetical protein CL625_02570, partial [Arenimonas sp.]|nr:hypothetical protein [Arenimonas sp.]
MTEVKASTGPGRHDACHGRHPSLRRRLAPPLRPAGSALHVLPDRAAVQARLRRRGLRPRRAP